METKDEIIAEKIAKIKERIAAAKETIRYNNNRIDSIYDKWRPTPKEEIEIQEMEETINASEKVISECEATLDKIKPLLDRLEKAKKDFLEYKDAFDYIELSGKVEEVQDLIILALK